MDDNLGYLFAAFAVTWLMIAGYLYYMNTQIRTLREDMEDFEEQVANKQ
jgi:CcmD family protein